MSKTSFAFALILLAACGDSTAKTQKGPSSPSGNDAGSQAGDAATPGKDAEVTDPVTGSDAGLDADVGDPTQSDAGLDADVTGNDDAGLDASEQSDDAGEDAAVEVDAGSDAGQGPNEKYVMELAAVKEQLFTTCKIFNNPDKYNVGSVEDTFDSCIANCVINASCAALKDAMCPPGPPEPDNSFYACQISCYRVVPNTDPKQYRIPRPNDGFKCSNGTRIAHAAVCDDGAVTYQTCPNHEEDEGCPTFRCDDGDVISAKFHCDGITLAAEATASIGGCKDGSDERECAQACAP